MKVAILSNLLRDEVGQDLIEYALVAALISLGAVAAVQGFATGLSTAFSTISSEVSSAVTTRH
ncbi:MAG: Flp family type IVb pilin [Candidatus Korobacteraceae bacterium]